jgi:chromosome partitioning protein
MTGTNFTKRDIAEHSVNAKRIAFVHHKGGTGKTTACLNIAGWLSKLNQKVLIADLDPQANASSGLGVDLKSVDHSMYDVFFNQASLTDIILETRAGVYLAPASVELLSVEAKLAHTANSVGILKKKLDSVDHLFDFILIDCPPGSTLLMMNGMVAAKNIIIPLDTGVFGFETLDALKAVILDLENELDISIDIIMALQKVFSPSLLRLGFTNKVHKMISKYFAQNGLQNCPIYKIPFSKKICLAQMDGLPISHYAKHSQVSLVFKEIAKSILKSFNSKGEGKQ